MKFLQLALQRLEVLVLLQHCRLVVGDFLRPEDNFLWGFRVLLALVGRRVFRLQLTQHALDLLDLFEVLLLEFPLEALLVSKRTFSDLSASLLVLGPGQEHQLGPANHEIWAVSLWVETSLAELLLHQLLDLHGHPLLLCLVEIQQILPVFSSAASLSSHKLRRGLQEQPQLALLDIRHHEVLHQNIRLDLQGDQSLHDFGHSLDELGVHELGGAVGAAETVLEGKWQVFVEQVQAAVLPVDPGQPDQSIRGEVLELLVVVFPEGKFCFGEVLEEDFEEGALVVFQREGVEALVSVDHFH